MPVTTPFWVDSGNVRIKTATASAAALHEDSFPHLRSEISSQEYTRNSKRDGHAQESLFTVNGVHYIVGERANRHSPIPRQHGAKRYTREYYGVYAAIGMARLFRRSKKNIFLVGSHPCEDVDYTEDLMMAAIGTWTVEWRGQSFTFEVVDATTLDEPLGGFHNAILRKDGRGYADKNIEKGITLTLDIGAFTTDGVMIDPGGDIDYSSADSAHIGILHAVQQFEKDFRTENRTLLKGVTLDESQTFEAIRTGRYNLRGLGDVDCSLLANEMCMSLINDVIAFQDKYGGSNQYDTLLFTGGGSALLEKYIRERVRHNHIVFADKDMTTMQMANVRGLGKWYMMHDAIGTFS